MDILARTLRWLACTVVLAVGLMYAWRYAAASIPGKAPEVAAFDILAWAGPWVLLLLITALVPQFAAWLLGTASAALVLLWAVWSGDPTFWLFPHDTRGPALAIAATIVGTALGVLGLRSPLVAGALLTCLTLLPAIAAAINLTAEDYAALTLGTGNAPFLLAGVVFVVAGLLPQRRSARRAGTPSPDTRFQPVGRRTPTRTW